MAKVHLWLLWFLPCVLSHNDGDIQLVRRPGSNFTYEGRVEIFHLGKWGTICDDGWGREESNVVCRQLGFPKGAQYWYGNAHFGEGNGTIYLDDVTCIGNETALINCKHSGWQGHNCHHYEDIGVVCWKEELISNPGTCDFEKGHGMCGYQLNDEKNHFNWTFGSRNTRYGWWPKTDHTTANSTGEGFYVTTFMKFWEDIMQGHVARLKSPTITSASCVEFYYFMGGSTVGELIVYIKTASGEEKSVWQLIGDQGYEWQRGAISVDSKYQNFNIIFEGVAGTGFYGNDVSVDDISVTNANCTLYPKKASPTPPVTPARTIRLVGKPGWSIKSAGRVEVFHRGRWGTICNWWRRSFDIRAANVVCKELGYEGAEIVLPCCEAFGKGTGRIWLDNVRCLGTEPSVSMCSHSGWGNTFCSHDSDISVVCKTSKTDRTDFDVRLSNDFGVNYMGRLEVKIGGIWGTVADAGWDVYDANVVCKELHFGGAVGAYTGSNFGVGKGPIWMSNFQCLGNESSLAKCNHTNNDVQKPWGHYRDASVECFDLRLASGGSNMSGRVEVMYSGDWGTVCNHNWDINAGNVVCRQLGFRRAEAVNSFGAGSGKIFLDKVNCTGNEPALSFCRHLGWYAHNCTHGNDAGVVCTNAICSKSNPCSNGGICNDTSGLCKCVASFVGELCQLDAGNRTVEVVFDEKLEQWNETSFKRSLVKDLNKYCSKSNCSTALSSQGRTTEVYFEDDNIKIFEPVKQQGKGLTVRFVVLYNDGVNIKVMPKSFIHDFFSSGEDSVAGYKVLTVDGETERSPAAGHHSNPKHKSKFLYIYIGVGVVLGLVALLALIFVVKRYGRRETSGGGAVPSSYSDQSYLALHTEDYDDSMDDTALLRPPQQPRSEQDLMS